MIVPAALEFLLENQPKLDVPERISEIVGDYGLQGVVLFSVFADENTEKTGIYYANLQGTLIWLVYDKKTTEAYQQDDVYIYHFFPVPTGGSDGCMMNTMTGMDNSLMMFFYDEEEQAWGLALNDFASASLYHIPSETSSSSQSSSVKSSASGSSAEANSDDSSSCAMSFLLLVAMIMVYLL